MRISQRDNFDVAPSLTATTRTASANGAGVDLANCGGATVVVVVGAWTDGTHAFKIQDSDDNSTFADAAAGAVDGAFAAVAGAGDAGTTQRVGYTGAKRYVRAVQTVSGATSGANIGAFVVRHDGRKLPR